MTDSLVGRYAQDEDGRIRKFRYAFALKPGFDFSSLKPYCDRIVYATDGYGDNVDNIRDQLEESLAKFDRSKDVIVPTGSAIACVLAGSIVQRIVSEQKDRSEDSSYAMAVYYEGSYKFYRVFTEGDSDSYEIIS